MDKEENADFRITRDGTWYHDGAAIGRHAIAKLFSDRALKVDEDGKYWLQSPHEKYPVVVEDVPYVIVGYEEHDGDFDLVTNMEEVVPLGPEHPLELRDDIPYVEVRDGLYARFSRSVCFNLAYRFEEKMRSRGIVHVLGYLDV